MTSAGPLRQGQWVTILALAVAVGAVHLVLVDGNLSPRLGEGAADAPPRRIDVAFVRVLAPVQPPATAPARPLPRVAAAVLPAASASASASAPMALPVPVPVPVPMRVPVPAEPDVSPALARIEPPSPIPELAAMAPALATAPLQEPAPAASAAAEAAFEWPPSTRLSYTLTGDYRGPVQGQAQVEWLRAGNRYQVHLDISVGPSFAPLLSRRITSEGEITADGLQPRRYDETTKIALREPRRLTIWLDADRVRLPAGTDLPRPAAVQDSASQFVQMTWLFTTHPERLRAGQTLSFPLALPRRVEPWFYDVLETQTLATPAGLVEAVHVKPRRANHDVRDARDARAAGDLTAEFWVAPSLQYLPVRILIRQDAQTYVDLLIERLPQQAERGR